MSDPAAMVAGMDPVLRAGRWVFVTSDDPALAARAVATFREDEGLSLIVAEEVAVAAGLEPGPAMGWITLGVLSALDGVGLTAAVASALARRGIACNVVAARSHDHLFVPVERAREALEVLRALAAGA